MLNKEYPAPFVPEISHEADVANFSPEFTEIAVLSLASSKGLQSPNSVNIEGFSYPKATQLEQENEDEEQKLEGPKLIYKEI